MPAALVDAIEHEYDFPAESPLTTSGLALPVLVRVAPPSDDAHDAVCDSIAAPFEAPAVNATDARPPGRTVALRTVGADGVVRGVTPLDASDALPVPAAFSAVTVNV